MQILTDSQVAIFDYNDFVCIAVRGTTSIRDWISNVQAVAVNFKEGKGRVHKGFYDCFLSVKDRIDKFMKENGRSKKKVVVTGHSLGGAVATLVAAYIRGTLRNEVMLYTFGSPRAGDADFVKQYSRTDRINAWRLFNVCDVVPLMPTERTNIALPLIITNLSRPHPMAFVANLSNVDLSPFTHFGVPVALKKTRNGGVMLIDPKTPPPFELYSSRETDEYRTKWTELARHAVLTASALSDLAFLALKINARGLFSILGDVLVSAHVMPTYLDIIGSVLGQWAKAYVNSEQFSHDPANRKHLEDRIQALRETEDQLMMESLKEEGIAMPDATGTELASMATGDKVTTTREALNAMQSQGAEMDALLRRLKNPQALADFICGGETNASLKKEIEYHATLN